MNTDTNLRELAKEYYFRDVKVEKYRDNFISELSKRTVIDKRGEGYHCYNCGKIGKEMAFSTKNRTIFPKNNPGELWIVNSHYDGCRGWD